jgi:hypothetical protein
MPQKHDWNHDLARELAQMGRRSLCCDQCAAAIAAKDAEIEKLEKQLATVERWRDDWHRCADKAEGERDKLKAEVEDLKRRRAVLVAGVPGTFGELHHDFSGVLSDDIEPHEYDNRTVEENAVWIGVRLLKHWLDAAALAEGGAREVGRLERLRDDLSRLYNDRRLASDALLARAEKAEAEVDLQRARAERAEKDCDTLLKFLVDE